MWRYSGTSNPDRASSEELSDDEVWSRLDRVLQLKPKEKVDGKPIPLNALVVSKQYAPLSLLRAFSTSVFLLFFS